MTRHKSRGFGYSIEGGTNRAFTKILDTTSIGPLLKTVNPVPKGLAIHPTYAGGVRPVHAIQHGGQ